MSNIHEQIVNKVQSDWSMNNRGRLFKNHSGGAELKTGVFLKYGLRSKKLTLPDLVGFEMFNGIPVFCCVEVKTISSPGLRKSQKMAMDMIKMFNGFAYIAMQIENDNYELKVY